MGCFLLLRQLVGVKLLGKSCCRAEDNFSHHPDPNAVDLSAHLKNIVQSRHSGSQYAGIQFVTPQHWTPANTMPG